MKQLIEEASKRGLVFYNSSQEHDILLLKWWVHLNNTGDFDRLFGDSQRPLAKFLRIFTPPCVLILAIENDNTWAAIWFTPAGERADAAFVGYWCDESKRGSRKHMALSVFTYDMAFKFWKVLVGVTKQECLLAIHRKAGYNIVGQVPYFMEGEDAWVLYLTEDNWHNSKYYQTGKKI